MFAGLKLSAYELGLTPAIIERKLRNFSLQWGKYSVRTKERVNFTYLV